MKKYLWITKSLIVTLIVISFVVTSSIGFAQKIYAQLSSAKARLSGAKPKTVEMENINANSGFDIASNGVTIKKRGVYFIMVEGQGGVVTQGQSQSGGYVKM